MVACGKVDRTEHVVYSEDRSLNTIDSSMPTVWIIDFGEDNRFICRQMSCVINVMRGVFRQLNGSSAIVRSYRISSIFLERLIQDGSGVQIDCAQSIRLFIRIFNHFERVDKPGIAHRVRIFD